MLEVRAAQDEFCAHFQANTSHTRDVQNADEGIAPLVTRKRRRAITDVERKALRDHYFNYEGGKSSQKAVQEWFFQEFRHLPSQSTISESLSKTFEHLDTGATRPDVKRQLTPAWVDLENALFEWQQLMEKKKATVTGDLLKEMASVFWDKLPQYEGQPKPKFSIGWLEGFKARHSIKIYRLYGEAGTGDMIVVEEELQEIRETLQPYDNEDVYNMDESALFWKMIPDVTLAAQQGAGRKHDKARITINLACNVTGSHKLDPWFIGKAAKPRCFGRSSINIKNF